jgi:hypothetical protein
MDCACVVAASPVAARRALGERRRMRANFYPELALRDGRRTIVAAGPLNWDEIPAGVERITVIAAISQNGVRGRSTSREYRREDREREWWCEVRAEGGAAFVPGPAPCAGTLAITEPRGVEPWPWPGDPDLVEE